MEDIHPLRIIRPAVAGQEDNPFAQHTGLFFQQTIQQLIENHRKDPEGYIISPFPIALERYASGIDPQQKINELIISILNALNVPNEFFTMNLQTQVLGPALRLFENSWSILVAAYNKILQKIADVIRYLLRLPPCTVELTPVTLSDDLERKSVIAQLASANAIARGELLRLYGFDFEDQLKKQIEEQRVQEELLKKEEQRRILEEQNIPVSPGELTQATVGPQDILNQATQIAMQLLPLDAVGRRQQLQQIKATDETLYAAVKQKLEELDRSAANQGKQFIIQQLVNQ